MSDNVISVDFKSKPKKQEIQEDNGVFQYKELMRKAVIGVFRGIIEDVMKNGIPESHSIYITFETTHHGVQLNESLKSKYPKYMSIILQHQYESLHFDADTIVVTLSFSSVPQVLRIPLASIFEISDPEEPFCIRAS